ncbi:MAG: hypothetical protein PHQ36_14375, partial [Anaerolineales bacterium]|nr:hypothetical protein [Anaerolineales bacterium]
MHIKVFFRPLFFVCAIFLLIGCAAQQTTESATPAALPTQIPNTATITGWFTTVWNGEPHYSITDDQGQVTKLLLDEELAKPLGGPLALDRKRVTISGEFVSDPQGALRVLSIRFE